MQKKDPKQYQDIISGKVLEYLERAFPNKVSVEELARYEMRFHFVAHKCRLNKLFSLSLSLSNRLTEAEPSLVYEFLRDLFSRGLVLYYDNGTTWIRNIINQQDESIHSIIFYYSLFDIRIKKKRKEKKFTVLKYAKICRSSYD